VLFGTGNAEPWNPAANGRDQAAGGTGSGDNLYTSSIVAVNADTGEYAWHFQETPEDRWDYDSDAQITLADLTIDGEQRHVAMHAPKNGYYYILDAKTGKFLSGTAWTAQNWTLGIDAVSGRPQINPDLRHSPAIGSADAVRSVVIDGALEHKGMVSFKEVVSAADAEAIRQYLIKRANEDKALESRTTARPVPRPPA
jgi:glucose dehydrogenase